MVEVWMLTTLLIGNFWFDTQHLKMEQNETDVDPDNFSRS